MTDDSLFDADLPSGEGAAVPPGREAFNAQLAPSLAGAVSRGATASTAKGRSARFAYYDTDATLITVAGPQEARQVDLALAYGMTYRGDRRLVLVLPRQYAFPTLQRVPWFKKELRPVVHVYDAKAPARLERPTVSRRSALDAVRDQARDAPADELRKASAPLHLGDRAPWVAELVDWAAAHPSLDPAHRPNVRSWQCRGQRVLSVFRSSGKSVSVVAGIHYSKPDQRPTPLVLTADHGLATSSLSQIKSAVEDAIHLRLHEDKKFYKPDEHWLQAVLRRDPELVGIEPPALREVPAWRPKSSPVSGGDAGWGRGFIDLVGLDAHGEMRLIETKLAANHDEMFILQGLDYYVWAQVYADALRVRLGAAHKAQPVVHFVIGAEPSSGSAKVSPFAPALASALDLPWRTQVVRGWWSAPPPRAGGAASEMLPAGQLPA